MATSGSAKSPAQTFALVFGAVYVLVGIAGFVVTGFGDFATFTDKTLIIFNINPLHNLVHLGIGAAWIFASRDHAMAKQVNLVIGVVYGLVAVLGFLEVEKVAEFLNIYEGSGDPDNFLHLASAAAALYFATAGAEGTSGAAAA